MANIERMTVVFPELMAVWLWFGPRHIRENELEHLRQAWDAGKASGTHGPVDFDDLRREARHRLTAAKEDAGRAG